MDGDIKQDSKRKENPVDEAQNPYSSENPFKINTSTNK